MWLFQRTALSGEGKLDRHIKADEICSLILEGFCPKRMVWQELLPGVNLRVIRDAQIILCDINAQI